MNINKKELYYLPIYSNSRDAIINRCISTLERGKKFIYILPSREAMFDVRSRLTDRYGGLINSAIFGFDDLEKAIVGDSIPASGIIDEETAITVLQSLCTKLKESGKFVLFKKVADKPGFIESLYKVIKRLKRLNLMPENFRFAADQICKKSGSGILKSKCHDVFEAYSFYEEYKREIRIYDIDDISFEAVRKAASAAVFDDVGLFVVDGFINIDPVNKQLMMRITDAFPEISFIVNVPYRNNHTDTFISGEVVKDFFDMGFEYMQGEDTDRSEIEKCLELVGENLFSAEAGIIRQANSIRILNAPCIENEVRQAAKIIKHSLVSGRSKPEKIAVYVNDLEQYEDAILKVSQELGIPVNLALKENMLIQPVVREILNAVSFMAENVSEQVIKSLVSSRYILPIEAAKGGSFSFNAPKQCDGCDKDILKALSVKREELGCGIALKDNIVNHLDLIIKVIRMLDVRNNLINLYKENIIASDMFIRDMKTLSAFIGALENMRYTYINCGMGNDMLDFESVLMLLHKNFSTKTVSHMVTGISGVRILNPDLARGQYYDMVFILGVNEGVLPSVPSGNVIFDGMENDLLFAEGINLNNYRWELQREKIRFNLACASALGELAVSFRTSDENGSFIIKSPFLEDFEQLFSVQALKEASSERVYMRDRFDLDTSKVMSGDEAEEAVITEIWQERVDNAGRLENLAMLLENPEGREEFEYVNAAGKVDLSRAVSTSFDRFDGKIGPQGVGKSMSEYTLSASQINSYAGCGFKYFAEKVLGLGSYDEDQELNAKNEGSLYHSVLKMYYYKNTDVCIFDENRLRDCVIKVFESIRNTRLNAVVFEARQQEIFKTLKEFILKDIGYFKKYNEKTGMQIKPVYLEEPFRTNDAFGNAGFKGVIDRVDLEVDGNGGYTGKFIIYDYKRRSISDLKACLTGGDYQLAIYYHSILKKLSGDFGLNDPECIALFYYSIENMEREGLIRAEYRQSLGFTNSKTAISRENFGEVMDWLKEQVEKLVDSIMNGNFMLPYQCPAEQRNYTCEFSSICRFDKYRLAGKS